MRKKPPLAISGCRVEQYAIRDRSMKYSGHSSLYRDGKEVGPVPRLAICRDHEGEVVLVVLGGLPNTGRLMRSDPTLGMVRPKARFDSYAVHLLLTTPGRGPASPPRPRCSLGLLASGAPRRSARSSLRPSPAAAGASSLRSGLLKASAMSASCLTRDLSAFQRGWRTGPPATASGRGQDGERGGHRCAAARRRAARCWTRPCAVRT